mgnify:CR=1 FL=1
MAQIDPPSEDPMLMELLAVTAGAIAPIGDGPLIEAEGGDTYIVRHDEPSGQWELAAYTSPMSSRTSLGDPESSHDPLN